MEDAERPLRVLSLDGGGVRGLASLIMLLELMEQVRREWERLHKTSHPELIKPCEYFDLICGTSTGGLIALMLGRLRYDVPTAIRKYQRLAKDIFTSKYSGKEAQFDHGVLERRIKKVIASSPLNKGKYVMMKDESFFPAPEGGCRTFVVSTSFNGSGTTAVLIRTYGSMRDNAFPATVWEAARATSAAPTFFKPITIDSVEYGDGGTIWNNPTIEAIIECHKIWEHRPIGCLISLGTGVQDPSQLQDRPGAGIVNEAFRRVAPAQEYKLIVAKYLISCLTNCEKVHSSISDQLGQYNLRGRYHRLNPHGMGRIGLQEWDKMGDIKALTESYMRHGEMGDLKVKLARLLLDPSTPESEPMISPPILDPPQQSKLGQNTLHLASLNGNVQKVRQILNQEYVGLNEKESERGWTPLMCAVSEGHEQVVRLLLDAWAKTDIPGQQLLTPLHLAVIRGHESVVRLLLNKDHETNTKDIHGQTPLHYAAVRGELDGIVQMLLRNSADVLLDNVDGNSPLNIAICDGNIDLVEYLLRVGTCTIAQEDLDEIGLSNEILSKWHMEVRSNPLGIAALVMALKAKRMEVVSLVGEKYISEAWSEIIDDSFQRHSPDVPYPSWEGLEQKLLELGREGLIDNGRLGQDDDGGDDDDDQDENPPYGGFFGSSFRGYQAQSSSTYRDGDEFSTSSYSLSDD